MDALRHALAWAREAEEACELGVCSVSMDALIVAGVRHLMNADACEKVEVSPGVRLLLPDAARERISALHQWIGRWRAAADEAAKLGLGRKHSIRLLAKKKHRAARSGHQSAKMV